MLHNVHYTYRYIVFDGKSAGIESIVFWLIEHRTRPLEQVHSELQQRLVSTIIENSNKYR